MDLETKVRDYIRDSVHAEGLITLPVSRIAQDIDSSTATVWRALQRLEEKRIIKVIRPRLKTQPNAIYYMGEEEELHDTIDRLLSATRNMLVILSEVKTKVREKDDIIFDLRKQLERK